MIEALDIWVKGLVQGVGFRPFVYRLAKKYLITGWVMNAVDGVHIHAEGEEKHLDEFIMELSDNAPAAAQVTEIEMHEVPLEPFDTFEIRFSEDVKADEVTHVSPDLAMCADCERELFDPADRRYRYPFINCTNCGPRFTIIDELPYDRKSTAMADFKMCDACQAEYDDPEDRRFHAQPNACFDCGPVLSLRYQEADGSTVDMEGADIDVSDAIFAKTVQLLREGKIVAIKGLGGFHLACDANNPDALKKLRERKRRDGKAFAVMVPSLDYAQEVCAVNDAEEAVLTGSARPIVLLKKKPGAAFAKGLADGLPELGVMLPYTPVQHILLYDYAMACAGTSGADADGTKHASIPMLVMTSGNVHDEPIAISNAEALEHLSDIADAFLMNDRRILTRFDDSVLRVLDLNGEYALQMIRRSRGYAPTPIDIAGIMGDAESSRTDVAAQGAVDANADAPLTGESIVFAAGPEQKNTFCFIRDGEGLVSQHIGDVENSETFDAWIDAKESFQRLFKLQPNALACDLHPEYLTSKWAHEQAVLVKPPLPLEQVQHHHAHIVSAMAENGLSQAVCGIAFDGTGYGVDGNIWGGEVLVSNLTNFERFANFAYVPMPGGAAAIKEPLRMAFGALWEFDLLDHPGAKKALDALGEDQANICERMIEQGINTPVTSSVGRLFDAASALLGVCTHPTYEGEAAILLEACLEDLPKGCESEAAPEAYSIDIIKNTANELSTAQDTSVVLLDAKPVFAAMLDDLVADVPVPVIAKRFHDALVDAIVKIATLCAGLYEISTVILTGGVFMNRYVMEHVVPALQEGGFTIALNRNLPPNDSCVSLGEAVVAAKRLQAAAVEGVAQA